MRNGFHVYDSDTHVNPAAEVLERYVDPGFRSRLAELAEYRFPVGQGAVGGIEGLHNYRVGTKYYRRVLGESGNAYILRMSVGSFRQCVVCSYEYPSRISVSSLQGLPKNCKPAGRATLV